MSKSNIKVTPAPIPLPSGDCNIIAHGVNVTMRTEREYVEVTCCLCTATYYANADKVKQGNVEALTDCPQCSAKCEDCNRDLCDLSCCFIPTIDISVDEILVTPADESNRPRFYSTSADILKEE